MVEYKFNEDAILQELKEYIDSTYDAHYAKGKIEALEEIVDDGHGIGFCAGNVKKYIKRYRKKGLPPEWRKDIIKTIHYGILLLYVHDEEHQDEN